MRVFHKQFETDVEALAFADAYNPGYDSDLYTIGVGRSFGRGHAFVVVSSSSDTLTLSESEGWAEVGDFSVRYGIGPALSIGPSVEEAADDGVRDESSAQLDDSEPADSGAESVQ